MKWDSPLYNTVKLEQRAWRFCKALTDLYRETGRGPINSSNGHDSVLSPTKPAIPQRKILFTCNASKPAGTEHRKGSPWQPREGRVTLWECDLPYMASVGQKYVD